MNHPTLEELTCAVHGFQARPAHLEACPACRTLESRLEDELELLRRADARLSPPARAALGSFWRLVPLGAVATVLVAIIATIALRAPVSPLRPGQDRKEPSTEELVRLYLDGRDEESARARQALLDRGIVTLPSLVEARLSRPDASRADGLADLILQLKKTAAGERGKPVFEKLETIKVSFDMQNADLDAAVQYLREITGLNLVVDPAAEGVEAALSLKLSGVPLTTALSLLAARAKLDYDFRYSVVFLARPDRLWSAPRAAPAPAALTEEQSKQARAWILKLGADSLEERVSASAQLRALGPAAIPLLEEGAKAKDAEVGARCRTLIAKLKPRPSVWGSLPPENLWRSQKLEGEGPAAVRRKLETMKIDLAFESTKMEDILAFMRDFSGLNILIENVKLEKPITIRVKDVLLADILELITLPFGFDVRVEGGVLIIFERRK